MRTTASDTWANLATRLFREAITRIPKSLGMSCDEPSLRPSTFLDESAKDFDALAVFEIQHGNCYPVLELNDIPIGGRICRQLDEDRRGAEPVAIIGHGVWQD